MIASSVYNTVITTLQNNAVLKGYVKYVFKGIRYDLEPESFPCLMVAPVSNNELDRDINDTQDIYLNLNIYGFAYNPADPEKLIIGDHDYRGIMDIEHDIKACLSSSNTLGNRVIDIGFDVTQYDAVDMAGKYPAWGFILPIKILYRQTNAD